MYFSYLYNAFLFCTSMFFVIFSNIYYSHCDSGLMAHSQKDMTDREITCHK